MIFKIRTAASKKPQEGLHFCGKLFKLYTKT
jgi:hypothetical protein